jgi:hypothetical protein
MRYFTKFGLEIAKLFPDSIIFSMLRAIIRPAKTTSVGKTAAQWAPPHSCLCSANSLDLGDLQLVEVILRFAILVEYPR